MMTTKLKDYRNALLAGGGGGGLTKDWGCLTQAQKKAESRIARANSKQKAKCARDTRVC